MKEMYGVVLLYTEGMAICEDDWENLWALRCQKNL